jgi:hypothetical protein
MPFMKIPRGTNLSAVPPCPAPLVRSFLPVLFLLFRRPSLYCSSCGESRDTPGGCGQALMAEANLLQSGGLEGPGPEGAAGPQLRESFARVLHDNAELRQRLNGIVRQRIASLAGKGSGARGSAILHASAHGSSPGARAENGSGHVLGPAGGPGASDMLAGLTGGANKLLTRLRSSPGGPRPEEVGGSGSGAAGGPAGGGSGSHGRPDGSGVLSGSLNRLSGFAQRFAGRDGPTEGN